jgi:hypothetical protein
MIETSEIYLGYIIFIFFFLTEWPLVKSAERFIYSYFVTLIVVGDLNGDGIFGVLWAT